MADTEVTGLSPEDYHLLVGPALQIAAEVAARRGDPYLYNDMASMLALMALVRGLCTGYRRDRARFREPADETRLEHAPLAACWMVLRESELGETQVDDCLDALGAATRQLEDAGVMGPERALVERAWRDLLAGERDAALGVLKLAAAQVVDAVDAWEARRNAGEG